MEIRYEVKLLGIYKIKSEIYWVECFFWQFNLFYREKNCSEKVTHARQIIFLMKTKGIHVADLVKKTPIQREFTCLFKGMSVIDLYSIAMIYSCVKVLNSTYLWFVWEDSQRCSVWNSHQAHHLPSSFCWLPPFGVWSLRNPRWHAKRLLLRPQDRSFAL